jgi:YD repeat-containing protein
MIEKNMLDFPISVKIYKKQSESDSTLISEMNYTYGLSNGNIVLSKVYQYDIKQDANILQTDFIKYDSQGNLLESAETNGVYSSYIWGYNGLHMIAKIENAKHSDIESIVGNSPLPGCLSTEQLSSIKANCPNANITTYEYKPLVGVSKIVNPNGEVFTYKYNGSGKLMGIYNSKGEKVEEALYSTDNKQ